MHFLFSSQKSLYVTNVQDITVMLVDKYAAFFNCTPVGRISGCMMAQI